MKSKGISRYFSAAMAAAFLLVTGVIAYAFPPGLVNLNGKSAVDQAAQAAAGYNTPVNPPPAYRPGEVLVKIRERALPMDENSAAAQMGAEKARKVKSDHVVPGLYILKLKPGDTVENKVIELKSNPDVEYAQPNYIYRAETMPNDTYFKQQWDMYNTGQSIQGQAGKAGADMKMPAAWSISTGFGNFTAASGDFASSNKAVVAVIDTGIDYFSPDLADNLWTNPSPGSYDSTNYPNDTHGINPLAYDHSWSLPYYTEPYTANDSCDPYDDFGHGSHVSGTIGAVGNNKTGIAGINWNANIMALKGLDYQGQGADSDLITCIDYAVSEKGLYDGNHADGANVRVINASWGGAPTGSDTALYNAIQTATSSPNNILFVAAAGNNGTDNDFTLFYPASWAGDSTPYAKLPNMIAVAATDNKDALASFSNYGPSVAVAAPGVNILSTIPVWNNFPTWGKLFYDTFENGMHWTTGGTHNTWGLTTESSVSPTHSLTDSPGALYPSGTNSWASVGPLNLTSSGWPLELGYYMKLALDPHYLDVVWIETSTDGTTWTKVGGWAGATSGYMYVTTDISNLANSSTAYVRFRLQVSSSGNYDGVHLDNVAIYTRPSSVQQGVYQFDSGTSMAAPHVTGLAALILAANPNLTVSDLKTKIIDSVDTLPNLQPPNTKTVASGGRVNAVKALSAALGEGLTLSVSQSGGYTIMTSRLISGGSLQYGKTVNFYQDSVKIGSAATGAYTSAAPGIATLKVAGTAGLHSAQAVSVAYTGVPSRTSSTVSYHTYPPTISDVSPSTATYGTPVKITGTYFGPTKGTISLVGAGTPMSVTPTFWNDTSISFKTPTMKAGVYNLTVKNTMPSAMQTFTVPLPKITKIDPSSAAAGVFVNMSGTGFGTVKGSISMRMGTAVSSITPTHWDNSLITFLTPPKPLGSYSITVTNTAGISDHTNPADLFTIPPMTITGPSPASAGAGILITVGGSNFGNVKGTVYLKSSANVTTPATPVSWNDTSVTFKVPALKTGIYGLSMKNTAMTYPYGTWSLSIPLPDPDPTGMNPTSAKAGTAVPMTIAGSYFGTVKGTVLVTPSGGGTASSVTPTAWSDNGSIGGASITVTLPGRAAGSYNITVKNSAGTSTIPLIFTVSP